MIEATLFGDLSSDEAGALEAGAERFGAFAEAPAELTFLGSGS